MLIGFVYSKIPLESQRNVNPPHIISHPAEVSEGFSKLVLRFAAQKLY